MLIAVGKEEMKRLDRDLCQSRGELNLIKKASEAIYESYPFSGPVCILCGGGNNGSDGLSLALILKRKGTDCTVLTLRQAKEGTSYETLYKECLEEGIKVTPFDGAIPECKEIVDCVTGTGFTPPLRENFADAVKEINKAGERGCKIISADINSGLDADSGKASLAVKSDITVSIGHIKQGLLLGDAKDYVGLLINKNIGFPPPDKKVLVPSEKDFGEYVKPRKRNSHKGDFGYITLICGSADYPGAAKLSSLSSCALRSGAGVVTTAVPDIIAPQVSYLALNETVKAMPSTGGKLAFSPVSLDEAIKGRSAVCFGMGIGRSDEHKKTLEYLLKNSPCPLIIDADGLNTLGEVGADILREAKCKVIVTPHPKEFERISGVALSDTLNNPVKYAEEFALRTGAIVLLKGASTVISDGNETYIVTRGSAGMACGGSGDVLSGVITAVVGYSGAKAESVAYASFLCGVAGEIAAERYTDISMNASDTANMIPEAVKMIRAGSGDGEDA